MGIGPVVAIPKALALAGLKLDDIGVIELNEAFAVQALAVIRAAGLDLDKVNVNGGAIALGHPLGCTGAKLTATILREMQRRNARYGMVTMCVGGGQGAAGIFERTVTDGTATSTHKHQGGSFLIEDQPPRESSRPKTSPTSTAPSRAPRDEFCEKEVAPTSKPSSTAITISPSRVLRKAAELGLDSHHSRRRRYGGMELDLTSAMVVAEQIARDGSYAGWHGAHAGIGTMPLLLFGTEEQKQKYLPKLATARTGRRLLPDRTARRFRRAGRQDPRRSLARTARTTSSTARRCGSPTAARPISSPSSPKSAASSSPRSWWSAHFPASSSGAEEKKMGIKGSSTTAVFFDNVQVPVENLLGELGRGHIIAFNILNLGRLKLGPFAVGGAKNVLRVSLTYAKAAQSVRHVDRRVRHDPAQAGRDGDPHLRRGIDGLSRGRPDRRRIWKASPGTSRTPRRRMMKAVEEFAAECSIIKVYASEVLDYVVDEGVQIHGGYGFHQDYAVERAYRDSRINRIFEGTNEINRLLITGMLLKRAQQGQLGLVKAAKGLMDEILAGPSLAAARESRRTAPGRATRRRSRCCCWRSAFEKFGAAMEKQQEVLAGIADVVMETFAMESALLRSGKDDARARI